MQHFRADKLASALATGKLGLQTEGQLPHLFFCLRQQQAAFLNNMLTDLFLSTAEHLDDQMESNDLM